MFINKVKLKKNIEFNKLKNLQKNSKFIGFYCLQNLSVPEIIDLKKNIERQGFSFKILGSTPIFRVFFQSISKMKGLISGSIGICYKKNKEFQEFDFLSLQNIFKILKKNKKIFFIGGSFNKKFINVLFQNKVLSLTNKKSTHIEQILLIQNQLASLNTSLNIGKTNLSFLLSKKKD